VDASSGGGGDSDSDDSDLEELMARRLELAKELEANTAPAAKPTVRVAFYAVISGHFSLVSLAYTTILFIPRPYRSLSSDKAFLSCSHGAYIVMSLLIRCACFQLDFLSVPARVHALRTSHTHTHTHTHTYTYTHTHTRARARAHTLATAFITLITGHCVFLFAVCTLVCVFFMCSHASHLFHSLPNTSLSLFS
jgi:hypothetical protein